jgi:hypothetical protein
MGKGALLNDAPRPSNVLPKGCWKGSVKKKAVQIFSGAPGAISPRIWRSFVDRQYSPLTGMGLSEWELTRMGYIVKKEADSDGNEWELHSPLLLVLLWDIAFVQFCCKMSPSRDFAMRYRLHVILLWDIAFVRFCCEISPSCHFVYINWLKKSHLMFMF